MLNRGTAVAWSRSCWACAGHIICPLWGAGSAHAALLSTAGTVRAAGSACCESACSGWTGSGQGVAWGLCCLCRLLQNQALSQWGRAANMSLSSPQPSLIELLTWPPAGGVGGPPKREACWAVAVGASQCPLECGAPVGCRRCPRAPPGLQRQPWEAPLWDGRSAAAHRGVVEGRWVLLLWSCRSVCAGGQQWLHATSAPALFTSCHLPAWSVLCAISRLPWCLAGSNYTSNSQIRNRCCAVQHCTYAVPMQRMWTFAYVDLCSTMLWLRIALRQAASRGARPCLVNEQRLRAHRQSALTGSTAAGSMQPREST